MLILGRFKSIAQHLSKHFKKNGVKQTIIYDFTNAKPRGPVFIYGTLGQPEGKDHKTSLFWNDLKAEDRDLIHHDESCYKYCDGCNGCTGYLLDCPYILDGDEYTYAMYSEKHFGIRWHYSPPDKNPHRSVTSMIESENSQS